MIQNTSTELQRKQELLQTINFNLSVFKLMHNRPNVQLTEKATEKLIQASWDENTNEIESIIEKAVQCASSDLIEPEMIQIGKIEKKIELTIGTKLDTVERQYILQTLYFVQQNRTKAAEILGISIRTLRNKLSQYRQEGYL